MPSTLGLEVSGYSTGWSQTSGFEWRPQLEEGPSGALVCPPGNGLSCCRREMPGLAPPDTRRRLNLRPASPADATERRAAGKQGAWVLARPSALRSSDVNGVGITQLETTRAGGGGSVVPRAGTRQVAGESGSETTSSLVFR